VRDQRGPRPGTLAELRRRLRPREEGLHRRRRLVVRAQVVEGLGEIVFRGRLHARVGRRLREAQARKLTVEPGEVRQQREVVEADGLCGPLGRPELLHVRGRSQVRGARHRERAFG